jgi:preprotein translocase subunit SecE
MAATAKTPQRNPFRRVAHFWSETMEELRKATWPGWVELRDSTSLVIITVILLGGYISVLDFFLGQLMTFFTNQAAGK